MATPEKLNLWDRFFNRYRKEILQRGEETWRVHDWAGLELMRYSRVYVDYKVIDRVTGSETIKREYLT
jgi:hypothetical protein